MKRPLFKGLAVVFGGLLLCFNTSVCFADSFDALSSQSLYLRACQAQSVRLNLQPIQTYLGIISRFCDSVSGNQGVSLNRNELAIAVAAANQVGQLTPQYLMSTGLPLVDQLELAQQTHQNIERLIHEVLQHRAEFSDPEYRLTLSFLLMARGVNLLGWAQRLWVAAAWKNYIVMPMPDLVAVLNHGIDDIQESLQLDQLTLYDPELAQNPLQTRGIGRKFYKWRRPLYRQFFDKRFQAFSKDGYAATLVTLAAGQGSSRLVAQRWADERLTHALAPVMFARSTESRDVLAQAARHTTINQIITDSDMNEWMMTLTQLMGLRR